MATPARLPIIGSWFTRTPPPQHRRFGDADDRSRRLRAQRLAMVAVTTGLVYLAWVWAVVDWAHPLVALGFLAAETCSLLLFTMAAAGSWRLRFKPEDAVLASLPEPVDVFITVSGEPLQVVARTIAGASQIKWQGSLRIYVLDDGGSPEVEAVALQHGALYRSRRRKQIPLTDGKAGMLNFGLSITSGAYVLTLDGDQVPAPRIVERLAPYLSLPQVAFVQSKQSFIVPDEDPFSSEQPVFYNTLQKAFDAHDTVLSCGSGVLYRRAALNSIGGFVTWNLVEDLTTSYELHSHGWKSLYYPYALSRGVAPDTLDGVYRQRSRWALDTLRLTFWRCPLFRQTLSWPKRLNYFVIGFSYLVAGFIAPLFCVIPVWSYLTGESLLPGNELLFAVGRSFYFATIVIALRWMFAGHQPGKQFQMLMGLFPVYIVSTLKALRYRNAKPHEPASYAPAAARTLPTGVALLPQLLLSGANILAPFYALLAGSATWQVVAAGAPVSILAVWSLSHVCVAAFNREMWSADRHPVRFYAPAAES